jgi:drug/metabolite transporter (DMT)-like permease
MRENNNQSTQVSIGYLSIFGSVIGFMSYYYLIKHASVKVVGIVPLITPIFALLLMM